MRKLLILTFCVLLSANSYALKVSDSFYFNSDFIKNNFSVLAKASSLLSIGAEVDYVNHDAFEDDIFTFSMPVIHTSDAMQFVLKPFYTPKTNDLYAYGALFNMLLALETNSIDDKYTQANLSVSYANQRADVQKDGGAQERKDYGEVAYGLSLRKNFYNAFFFGVQGSAYQYLNGVSNVQGIRTILDQNQLANLSTLDVIYNLPKYSLGASFNRMLGNGANVYLSYSFIEYYTTKAEHSLILGNDFPISKIFKADLAYNHIIADKSKRDIFKVSVTAMF